MKLMTVFSDNDRSFCLVLHKRLNYSKLALSPPDINSPCFRKGLSKPESYGDLVYKFNKLIGSKDFSFQFRKIITRYRRIGYNLNVMRQSAFLVF